MESLHCVVGWCVWPRVDTLQQLASGLFLFAVSYRGDGTSCNNELEEFEYCLVAVSVSALNYCVH